MSLGYLDRAQAPDVVLQIQREQRSLRGWRSCLVASLTLLAELSQLKGAQHFRRRIDDLRHQIGAGIASNDLEVLRNTTATADMAMALYEAEKALPGKAWLFGRGRCRPGEPMYGFAVFETRDAIADGEPLVMVAHDDPRRCVVLAVEQLNQKREPRR